MTSLQAAPSATGARGQFSLTFWGAVTRLAGSCGTGLEPVPRADAWLGDKHTKLTKPADSITWPDSVSLCKTGLIPTATRRAKSHK